MKIITCRNFRFFVYMPVEQYNPKAILGRIIVQNFIDFSVIEHYPVGELYIKGNL